MIILEIKVVRLLFLPCIQCTKDGLYSYKHDHQSIIRLGTSGCTDAGYGVSGHSSERLTPSDGCSPNRPVDPRERFPDVNRKYLVFSCSNKKYINN